MMCNPKTHPANYVDFDYQTGEAQSAFHCMIIGFGETGEEAFKFLYEHGQFVYPDSFKGKHIIFHIVDPKASQKKGFFEMRYPCLNPDNHFSVPTGSDNRNIAIAYDLGEYTLRWRKRRLEKFCIVTRCYNNINESRYEELSQLCLDEEKPKQIVQVIGKMSESFTHKYVWKSYLEQDAAIYSATFAQNIGKDFHDIHIFTKLKVTGIMDRQSDSTGRENLLKLKQCKTLKDLEKLPFFNTLVRMEHARCLASHECQGYTPMTIDEFEALHKKYECDVIRHKSLNLVAWEDLNSLPTPTWLKAITPATYKDIPNIYLLENMVQILLSIGLSKLNHQ